ncbi:MAG: response regulator [Lachnospiraceae bacterium]|nr:response regulator [Lachnospiraceae bacterium]
MDEIKLTDLISVPMLQSMQDAFSEMMGMAAITTDETSVLLTKPSGSAEFFDMIAKSGAGSEYILEEIRVCVKNARETRSCVSGSFMPGVLLFAAPIIAEDVSIGCFVGGPVRTTTTEDLELLPLAEKLGITQDYLHETIETLPLLGNAQLDRASELLTTVTKVLSDMALGEYHALKAREELERTAQMKSDFLANMSHEIRTPMNAVIGMAEMALREDIPDSTRNYITQIKSSGRALLTIINDILDFSKIEAGKLTITPAEYEPMSLFNDVSNILMTRLADKDVALTLDIAPDLPQKLFGDALRIRQILINLANNAIKFTNQGQIKITVDLEMQSDVRLILKCSVTDTGIGIKPEDLEKIFESFQQVDSTRNRNVEGTGLGLAITKKLLTLMGGNLSVESEYEKGSTFSFELPQFIVDKTPSMKVREPEKLIGVGLFDNHYLADSFMSDSADLGVTSFCINRSTDIAGALSMFVGRDEDKTVFLFFEAGQLTSRRHDYISANQNTVAVMLTDFNSDVKLASPNMLAVSKPLSAMNLAMIYNREPVHFNSLDASEDEDIDFIAPDAHILVVDDNPVNLTVAEGLLEPLKLKVDTAESGREAVKRARENSYDLILMDHMMPEMDGIDATRLIRRLQTSTDYTNVPILALTANAIDNAREMFLSEGLDDFIAKPIEVRILMTKLKQWLPPEKIKKAVYEPVPPVTSQPAPTDSGLIIGDLDTASAISLLGTEKLYMSVLKEYLRMIRHKAELIRNCMKDENWKAYTIEVHALKSSSRQIGATKLGDMAFALEKAGNAQDIEFINLHTYEALEKYLSYEPVLAKLFEEDAEKQDEPVEKKDIDVAEMTEIMNRIRASMEELDTDAMEDVANELNHYTLPLEQQEIKASLHEAIENMDIDECEELLDKWEKLLN